MWEGGIIGLAVHWGHQGWSLEHKVHRRGSQVNAAIFILDTQTDRFPCSAPLFSSLHSSHLVIGFHPPLLPCILCILVPPIPLLLHPHAIWCSPMYHAAPLPLHPFPCTPAPMCSYTHHHFPHVSHALPLFCYPAACHCTYICVLTCIYISTLNYFCPCCLSLSSSHVYAWLIIGLRSSWPGPL